MCGSRGVRKVKWDLSVFRPHGQSFAYGVRRACLAPVDLPRLSGRLSIAIHSLDSLSHNCLVLSN